MLIDDFNYVVDNWIKELERYHFTQLYIKPSPAGWSLGQLYMHLIADTNFYLEQIEICTSTNDNANEEASPAAKTMFRNNEFPDERIEGALSHCTPSAARKQRTINFFLRENKRRYEHAGNINCCR